MRKRGVCVTLSHGKGTEMDDCLFCKIARGDLPCHKLFEDAGILAFLDLHPIRPGHTLIIPKEHHVWFEDMPPVLAAHVTHAAQRVARALKTLRKVERVAMFYTGIHVPHVHAHVVPMHHVHDVTSAAYLHDGPEGFSTPPQQASGDMEQIAANLRVLL